VLYNILQLKVSLEEVTWKVCKELSPLVSMRSLLNKNDKESEELNMSRGK
jgi:hypothetical protein